MGTDIHAAIEVRKEGRWQAVKWPNKWYRSGIGMSSENNPETYDVNLGRNYDLFAILANVRNGKGFAGCDTGDGFNFISNQRGLPEDMSPEARYVVDGDHSESWISLAEILAFDWTQTSVKRGWVSAQTFEKWDRLRRWEPWPDEYNGGISGPTIEHISEQEMRRRIKKTVQAGTHYHSTLEVFLKQNADAYCLISWEVTYADAAKEFWVTWVPRMLKLMFETTSEGVTLVRSTPRPASDIRLVFNFDS